jgi:chromosome segregation ATPase
MCSRHFDADYDLCTDCASELRRDAEREAVQLAALRADLQAWQQQAEAVAAQAAQPACDLAAAREDLRKGVERARALEAELAAWCSRAAGAERDLSAANQRRQDVEKELTRYAATEAERRALGRPRVDPVEVTPRARLRIVSMGLFPGGTDAVMPLDYSHNTFGRLEKPARPTKTSEKI